MQFKYFNLAAIRAGYQQQIDEFIIEYMFLFPFTPLNSDFTGLAARGRMIILITEDCISLPDEELHWDDLSVEELEMIIERLFDPAQQHYETRERGTRN